MPEVAELREEFQKSIAICAYACLLIAPVCIPLFTVLFLTEASLPPEAKEQAQKIGAMISAMYRVVPFTLIPAIVCGVLAYRLKKAGGELNLDHAKYIAISIGLLIPSFFIPVLVLWPVARLPRHHPRVFLKRHSKSGARRAFRRLGALAPLVCAAPYPLQGRPSSPVKGGL